MILLRLSKKRSVRGPFFLQPLIQTFGISKLIFKSGKRYAVKQHVHLPVILVNHNRRDVGCMCICISMFVKEHNDYEIKQAHSRSMNNPMMILTK